MKAKYTVWVAFFLNLTYGTFFLHKIGSIISIGDLPTTNIIEPKFLTDFFYSVSYSKPVFF